MANIVDYLKEVGKLDFSEREFVKEDALALCQLCYLKFDELMEEMKETPVSLREMYEHEKYESLYFDYRYEKDNRALFMAMLESKRFSELKCCFHVNRIDTDLESQFCAVTFILSDGRGFIAFRGTDETIVGWQEDCKLALLKPIKGQTLSAKYINDVAGRISGNFMVGGHSKGGNLAMYSAMNCSDAIRERITKIYSFDGPGFRPDVLEKYCFNKIEDKIVSVIPKSSVVGLLLAVNEKSIVVNSKSIGMLQHNPYNWIMDGDLLSETHLTEQHFLLITTFNEWLYGLDDEHLDGFITMLVEMLNSTQADTTMELSADTYKYAVNVIKAQREMDEETKNFLSGLLKSFFDLMMEKMKTEVSSKIEVKKEEVSQKFEDTKNEMEKRKQEMKKKKSAKK